MGLGPIFKRHHITIDKNWSLRLTLCVGRPATAGGSFSPETSMLLVNGYWSGMRWEATAATQCKQNTLLYQVGLSCLTERQWVLFHSYSLLHLLAIQYYE